MRRYLSLMLLIGFAWGQPSIQWTETYGNNNYDASSSGFETENGEIVIAGRSNVNATGQDGYIIKIDSSGQEIWANTYNASDGTQSDYINDIIETYDGGYLATGTSHTNTWLIKLDSDGNATWNNTYIGGGGRVTEIK